MYVFFFPEISLTVAVTTLYLEGNANALGCTGFSLSDIRLALAAIAITCIKFMFYYQLRNRG
jgi:hypothetical protein